MDELAFSFLDIDGVLNSSRSVAALGAAPADYDVATWEPYFDPVAVKLYRRFIRESSAKTVLSSSWRHEKDIVPKLADFLQVEIISQTPYLPGQPRGEEVKSWFELKELSPIITPYVIFDDRSDFLRDQRRHFIHVSGLEGLSLDNYYTAMKILNIKAPTPAVL